MLACNWEEAVALGLGGGYLLAQYLNKNEDEVGNRKCKFNCMYNEFVVHLTRIWCDLFVRYLAYRSKCRSFLFLKLTVHNTTFASKSFGRKWLPV